MKHILFTLLVVLAIWGCNSDDDQGSIPEENSFDINTLLSKIVDESITPQIKEFITLSETMNLALTRLAKEPNLTTLTTAKTAWKNAAIHYEKIYHYSIGPVKEQFKHQLLFTYPIQEEVLEALLNDQDIEITKEKITNSGTTIKGFATIEYFIFGKTPHILEQLKSERRKRYLTLLGEYNLEVAKSIQEIWLQDPEKFALIIKENNGTGLNSSINLLFNGSINILETLSRRKIGKPAGLVTTSTTNTAELQGVNSETELLLIKSNLQSIETFIFGNRPNNNGLANYINSLNRDDSINTRTKNLLTKAIAQTTLFDTSLKEAIENNDPKVEALFTTVQELLVHFKTDITSLLNIIVTSTDNDGD